MQLENNENEKARLKINQIIISIKNETERLESLVLEKSTDEIMGLSVAWKLFEKGYQVIIT